jgi:predicted transcriptional regulator with HTH domain
MKISNQKREKIYEQILALLYSISPKSIFISNISKEIARDEEFVKSLILDLNKKNLITEIKKNPKGKDYHKRSRWKLSDEAYQIYKKLQFQKENIS